MKFADTPVPAGLHFVSVPIGNARDITLRALDVLAGADRLLAEDTRALRRLMQIHGLRLGERDLSSYHDHSPPRIRERTLAALGAGQSVAYASEAGTPLLADPGFDLARAAIAAGVPVFAVPGASALLSALAVSGLPGDKFFFAGFLPRGAGPMGRALAALKSIPGALVVYEAPARVARTLHRLAEVLGPDRPAAVCRELTKKFEEVRRGTLGGLAEALSEGPARGEFVIVVDRGPPEAASDAEVDDALREAMTRLGVKAAATEIAGIAGRPRRDLYARALALKAQVADTDESR